MPRSEVMTFESALSAQYMKAGNRFASPRKVLPDVEVAKLIDGLGLALETGREPLGVGLAYINFPDYARFSADFSWYN